MSPSLPSLQVNMADSCCSKRDHSMSRIFERTENFQNDCCRPWTKSLFKNSYSRVLRVVNPVVSFIASKSDDSFLGDDNNCE